jgi:hypothetical protein
MILLNFFTDFYEAIIGTDNTGLDYQNAFDGVGLITTLISIGSTLIFYLFFGRWKKPVWFKLSHWIITMGINSALCFGLALWQASSSVEGFVLGGYAIKFALINAAFAALVFFIFSVIIKRQSIYSKYIPFKKP